MARRATCTIASPGQVALALSPRHGLVLEELVCSAPRVAPGETCSYQFSQRDGPFATYRRTVELSAGAEGRINLHQVVEGRLGLPWWSWLLSPLLWKEVGAIQAQPPGQKMPWWAPPARLDHRSSTVLAVLATVVAVEGFLGGLLPQVLSYASSEMHVHVFGQGLVFAAVELSALPALLALVRADQRGRRGVVLGATAMAAGLSALTGFSPSMAWLAGAQVAAGALLAAAGIASTVIAVEEVPAGCRAWAFGILGLAAGFGAGVPLALLPLAGIGAGGWRWLFWLSLVCVPVVWRCQRQLPESQRWARAPKGSRLRGAPGRHLALVCAGAALFALFATPAGQFEAQFLRHERHYSALAISVLEQLAGTVGALGVLFGGRLADTHGRRPVAAAAVAGSTVAVIASYATRSALMWVAAIVAQFFLYATGPALGVYGVELFVTRSRARAAGLVSAAAATGGVVGLLAVAGLDDWAGDFARAFGVISIAPLLLVALLLLAYPETAATELPESPPLTGTARDLTP